MRTLVNKKSAEILSKVENVSRRIETSKKKAKEAGDMKTGLFKTRKKVNATADALVSTDEAVAEMNTLIQESIQFTCTSIEFSTAMHQSMAKMIAEGFKDSNGEIVKLNKTGEEYVNLIISEAEDFTIKQLEVEKLQAEQAERIKKIKSRSDQRDTELEDAIKKLKMESDKKDAKIEKHIKNKTAEILSLSESKDIQHDQQIGNLQKLSAKILN